MTPIWDWRLLMECGLVRCPRRGPATPEDLAAIWQRLSERRQAEVARAAADAGLTIEMHIRQRYAHCQRVLFGTFLTHVSSGV